MATVKDMKAEPGVRVGVLDGSGGGSETREGGLTNAEIAAIHEFGTGTIPARPFISASFEQGKPGYINDLKKLLGAVFAGRLQVMQVFDIMGSRISTDIKKFVTAGDQVPPPNAESTRIRKEKKTKRGGVPGLVRTLVDTGQMINSVTWQVIRGDK